jgi:hypothetical protein
MYNFTHNYRHNGQQRYNQRTTVNISCEWKLLERVREIAKTQRYTLSEIVQPAFERFIRDNQPTRPPPSMSS